MRYLQNPQAGPKKGKLLAFRPRPRSSHSLPTHAARVSDGADVERRMQLVDHWSVQLWLLLAWMLAVGRLHLAVVQREVFGPEATLAFLLAVVMPIVRARTLFRTVHIAVQRLRDAFRARSVAKH
jgi:hypothetical protein